MNRTSFLLLLAICFLIPAAASEHVRVSTSDGFVLQGSWKAWLGDDDYVTMEIKDDTFKAARHFPDGATSAWSGRLAINEQTEPKLISWIDVQGQTAENHCIYEIHGDTWILIGAGPGTTHKHFYSGDGDPHKAWILKRVSGKVSGELALLQGRWQAWLSENDVVTFDVAKDVFSVSRNGQKLYAGFLSLDSKTNPKQMNWNTMRDHQGNDLGSNLCIYEIAGETLLLMGSGPNQRPDHFVSGDGKPHKAWILKHMPWPRDLKELSP